jgi:hypothetical protein
MLIQEIANTMSDLEAQALEGFQQCAANFDAFNKGAAEIVRKLLQEIQQLREENNSLRIQLHKATGQDNDLDSSLVGGTD